MKLIKYFWRYNTIITKEQDAKVTPLAQSIIDELKMKFGSIEIKVINGHVNQIIVTEGYIPGKTG